MYGFLILLPLTLISLLIGSLIASSTQVVDYVAYVTALPGQKTLSREILANKLVWVQIGSHLLAYVIISFAAIATVRTISAPLPSDRPVGLRFFQVLLEIVFVAVPSAVLLWVTGHALIDDLKNFIHWLTVAVLCVGMVTTVVITAMRRPLELYASSARPFAVTKVDAFAALSVTAIVMTAVAYAFNPVVSANSIGMFPVLMLAAAATFLVLAAIFSRRASPVAIISSLITGVLCLHLIDQFASPPREFRYKNIAIKARAGAAPSTVSVSEVKEQRKILDLLTAFRQWLEYRRPAIEAYKRKGRTYPVFLISAQGGGMYAAYHPALSLARLTDQCPEFAHHVFGISSVSGGSLGAAVFSELLRTLPPTAQNDPASPTSSCTSTASPIVNNVLQAKVQEFFATDFLTPVIASAVIFDIPSLFIPQLRFGQDRARALELAFETAWQKLGVSGRDVGLAANFFERWEPTGLAPALFMSTTGVNFGIPVLVSQIDWSYSPISALQVKRFGRAGAAQPSLAGTGLLQSIRDRLLSPEEELQVGIANILDLRPDLQMATSTAVVLSARFPFVTPPGAIVENSQIVRSHGLYQKTKVLELTDGAFYDNSGGIVARDIIAELLRRLDNDEQFKEFRDSIKLELIRFTDTPAKRQGDASQTGHFELVTPIVAYDAVRQSRGVLLPNPPRKVGIWNIFLLDEWYEGSLNWLLSEDTKVAVETRSSWLLGFENEVCCEVRDPAGKLIKRIPLTGDQEQELSNSDDLKISRFVPNARAFLGIINLVNHGAIPNVAAQVATPPTPSVAPVTADVPPPAAQPVKVNSVETTPSRDMTPRLAPVTPDPAPVAPSPPTPSTAPAKADVPSPTAQSVKAESINTTPKAPTKSRPTSKAADWKKSIFER
jgi:hypothetical protein